MSFLFLRYTFNFYNIFNHKSTIGKTEAKDTYDFIRKSLQEAKKKKEKVQVVFKLEKYFQLF